MISTFELLVMPVRLVLFGVSPRRVCLALAAAAGLAALATWAALDALDRAELPDF